MLVYVIGSYFLIWFGFGSFAIYAFWHSYQRDVEAYQDYAKSRFKDRLKHAWKRTLFVITEFTTLGWLGIWLLYLAMIGIHSLLT